MIKVGNGLGDWYAVDPEPIDQAAELRKTVDQRTSQLINELFNSRARLERVVQDACEVVEIILAGDASYGDDLDYCIGVAQQFLDTHRAR